MTENDSLQPFLASVAAGGTLSREQAAWAFGLIMSGGATDAQIGALLGGIAARGGPVADEITGAAEAMRSCATGVDVPAGMDVIDTCGTGGDASGTFNISTGAALVAAGAGAKVAKHGNRSVTSKSGSSQVLEALGVRLGVGPAVLGQCLSEAGLCFCFAPAHHPAMKHAIGPRRELGFRTIFNVLGPLTNPAGAKRQVMGVYDAELTETIASVLGDLGSVRAMVVHGRTAQGGLDEITTTGPTRISHWIDGAVRTETIEPQDVGVEPAALESLQADGVEASADILRRVLGGEAGPAREIVALNAGAALVVAGLADGLSTGVEQARGAIDSGAAAAALESLVRVTNEGE